MKILLILLLSPLLVFAKDDLRVIDGDTIYLNENKIRFSGIDAPEIKQKCKKNRIEIFCGIIAKKLLEEKIGNKSTVCVLEGKDRYERMLGECFTEGESLSKYIVKQGFAFAYTRYSKKFVEDEKLAIKNKAGMWSMDFIFPWDFRKNNYKYK